MAKYESPDSFSKRAKQIVNDLNDEFAQYKGRKRKTDEPEISSAEGKRLLGVIVQSQKELRQLKSEVGLIMKSIRADFTAERSKAQSSGHALGAGIGIISSLFGKKSTGRKLGGRLSADNKERLRRQQEDALKPYMNVSRALDDTVLQCDKFKLVIDAARKEK